MIIWYPFDGVGYIKVKRVQNRHVKLTITNHEHHRTVHDSRNSMGYCDDSTVCKLFSYGLLEECIGGIVN